MRDECFCYFVGRPARESISDVLASRRWRGGTAADMVLAPLLVSNAGRAKPLSPAQLKRLSEMDQKLQRAAPDDRLDAQKAVPLSNCAELATCKTLENPFKSGTRIDESLICWLSWPRFSDSRIFFLPHLIFRVAFACVYMRSICLCRLT